MIFDLITNSKQRPLAAWLTAITASVALSGCGSNKVATECFDLQQTLLSNQSSPAVGTVTKASETTEAQQTQNMAAALTGVEISDEELILRRDQLVALFQQQSELGMKAAEFVREDGALIKSKSGGENYETLANQKREAMKKADAEQNSLQIYCSLQ